MLHKKSFFSIIYAFTHRQQVDIVIGHAVLYFAGITKRKRRISLNIFFSFAHHEMLSVSNWLLVEWKLFDTMKAVTVRLTGDGRTLDYSIDQLSSVNSARLSITNPASIVSLGCRPTGPLSARLSPPDDLRSLGASYRCPAVVAGVGGRRSSYRVTIGRPTQRRKFKPWKWGHRKN